YLKNGILAGKQEAQICRNDELMPNDLLPIIKRTGTVNPINGPATYHGQGCFKNSNITFLIFKAKIAIHYKVYRYFCYKAKKSAHSDYFLPFNSTNIYQNKCICSVEFLE